IVRGTTAKKIVKMLRRSGAKEIHFRISCPPIINACYYGIDTPNREKLIGYNMTVDEMREYLGVDSLAFQTIDGMVAATGMPKEEFCLACFNNDYPTPTPGDFAQARERRRLVDTSMHHYEIAGYPILP